MQAHEPTDTSAKSQDKASPIPQPAESPELPLHRPFERSTLLIDAVRRGPMMRQNHANGTLVPEDQRIVSALTAGRVDKVLVRPGAKVTADQVLVELSNPDVLLEYLDAERNL